MKKYLGIVKKEIQSMSGLNVRILTRFSDEREYLESWIKSYPTSEYIIIENTEQLEHFFLLFEDFTPITEEEKQRAQEACKLYQEIMQDK